ncbi:MAG: mucoidy inhibitor MuiA family protein [Acidobacteria bacterium]|nr:mucoidy inhibitor MuiA family protein [Acidobacteriota bacterium]
MRPISPLLLLFPLACLPAFPAEVAADSSRVVRVTVYADRAEVIREAEVRLPAGPSAVLFADLPEALDPDSLRVAGRGIPAAIGAVELRAGAGEPEVSPEHRAAQQEVERLQRELGALDAQEQVANDLVAFLREPGKKLGELKSEPDAIATYYALLKTSLDELARERLARDAKRVELREALNVAQARLQAARPKGAIRSRVASVEIEARQAGALALTLAYVTPNVSWRPSYRATLDADRNEIELVAEAVVRQRSGEDWNSVELVLSTGAPADGVAVPELASWLLAPALPLARNYQGALVLSPGVAAKTKDEEMADVVGGFAPVETKTLETEIVHNAYNVAFTVPGKSEIAADGRDHRVVLRRETLKPGLRYRAVPEQQPAAFLVAKASAPAEYPLLAGDVRMFAGPAYLGEWTIEATGPDAELELPFGVDNRIAVKRVTLPESRSHEGFVGKDRQVARAFRTTIENLRGEPVEIVVEERIPVSQDERIRVTLEDETTPGHVEDKDRPGILQWTVTLKPKEKRDITVAYSVRFPKDLPVNF